MSQPVIYVEITGHSYYNVMHPYIKANLKGISNVIDALDKTYSNVSSTTCFCLMSHSEQFHEWQQAAKKPLRGATQIFMNDHEIVINISFLTILR